jgi:hypothetical protein
MVSGATRKWRSMQASQCLSWTPNGDLLIREAERIVREHNITEVNGATRLAKVYAVLRSGAPAATATTAVVDTEIIMTAVVVGGV